MPELDDPRQERAVRAFIRNANKTRAYAEGYGYREIQDWHTTAGARLFGRDSVKSRVDELRANMVKRADVTEDRILTEYEEARAMAKGLERPADMLKATELKARLVGLHVDRTEVKQGQVENAESIGELVQLIEGQIGEDAARAFLAVFTGADRANLQDLQESDEADGEALAALANTVPEGNA